MGNMQCMSGIISACSQSRTQGFYLPQDAWRFCDISYLFLIIKVMIDILWRHFSPDLETPTECTLYAVNKKFMPNYCL